MSPTPPPAPLPDKILLNSTMSFRVHDDWPHNSVKTGEVIRDYRIDEITFFLKTGIGEWLRPNDPALMVHDALRQIIEVDIRYFPRDRVFDIRLCAQTDKLIDMFGTRDKAEIRRRIEAYINPSPADPTAGDGAGVTADAVTS